MKKYTMSELRQAVPHWFNKSNMEFFQTKIVAQPNKVNIFITSERPSVDDVRLYSLRWFNPETKHIETLGDFHRINTLVQARKLRKLFTVAYEQWHNAPYGEKKVEVTN